jgi:tetratricopeptide (TPR) repeat protein
MIGHQSHRQTEKQNLEYHHPLFSIGFALLVFFLLMPSSGSADEATLLKTTAKRLSDTGGRDCVHRAVARLVGDQNVQVIGAGSHVSGNYTPGSSDHDFTLRLTDEMSDRAALDQWKASRTRLEFNVRFESERVLEEGLRRELEAMGMGHQKIDKLVQKMRPRIKKQARRVAQGFLKKTNLYPPAQLMAGVEDAAGAMRRFKEMGVTPALTHHPGDTLTDRQWAEASEGIWGDGGVPFRQQYEEKAGRIWYKDTVIDADGVKATKVRSGFTDISHMADGYGKYTVKGSSSASRQWCDIAQRAASGPNPDFRVALKDMERAHLDMKKALDLASMPNASATPLAEFYDDFQKIKKAAANLPPARRTAAINEAINQLFQKPGYRRKFTEALDVTSVKASMLETMADSRKGMRRAVIREMLEGSTHPAQKLWGAVLEAAKTYPVEHILDAIFVYWDTVEAANRAGTGDLDGAARKAFEALTGALAGLAPGLLTSLANLIIDAAKDAGYMLAVSCQDCLDLLAGIISVKGWESVDGFGSGAELSIDDLARNIVHEKRIKDVVETAIANAAQQGGDSQLVTAGKRKALQERCEGRIINAWRDARMKMFKGFLDTLAQIDDLKPQLGVMVDVAPSPVRLLKRSDGRKSANVSISARLRGPVAELHALLGQAGVQIRAMGGRRGRTLFDPHYRISWSGITPPSATRGYRSGWPEVLDTFSIAVDEPGELVFACTVALELRVQSTITDSGDFDSESFSFFGNLLEGKLPWFAVTHKRGDALTTHADKTGRHFVFECSGAVEIQDSDLDDRLIVRIQAPYQALAGEAVALRAEVESPEEVADSELEYRWEGAKDAGNGGALFRRNATGTYAVGLTVSRHGESGAPRYKSPPVEIMVVNSGQATFSMEIRGAQAVSLHEDLDLRANVRGDNFAGERVLADPDVFIRWAAGGQDLDTGPSIRLQAPEPGAYDIKAMLVDDREGRASLLATATHRVRVVAPEKAAPAASSVAPSPDPDRPDQSARDAGKTAGAGGRTPDARPISKAIPVVVKSARPGSKAIDQGGVRQKGLVKFGTTLQVDLGQAYRDDAADVDAANRKFDELFTKANADFKNKTHSQQIPADVGVSVEEMAEEPEITTEDVDGGIVDEGVLDDPDIVMDPDLPTFPATDDDGGRDTSQADADTAVPDAKPVLVAGGADLESAKPPAYRFVFLSSPTLEFDPPESSDGRTSVVIDRLGEIRIWAEVHSLSDPDSGVEETPQYIYTVKPPAFHLSCSPAQPAVAQEVRAKVTASPVVPDRLVEYVWLSPGAHMTYASNGSEVGFTMASTDPVEFNVEARVPHWGSVLGSASCAVRPSAYRVSVLRPKRLGPPPMIWDPRQKGLVEVPRGVATFQNAEVVATITPSPPGGIRYRWTASPPGCSISAPFSATTRVNASSTGSYRLTLLVTDKNGVELGSGSTTFMVTTDREKIGHGKRLAEAYREAEALLAAAKTDRRNNHLERAIDGARQALSLVPDHREAKTQLSEWEADLRAMQERFRVLVAEGTAAEKAGQLETAVAAYEGALEIRDDQGLRVKVRDLQKRLSARKQAQAEEKQFDAHIKRGFAAEKSGSYSQAIDHYKKAFTVRPDPKIKQHIQDLEATIAKADNSKRREADAKAEFDTLLKSGYSREKAGDLQGAVSRYSKAVRIRDDPKVQERIKTLKKKVANKNRKQRFQKLLTSGYQKEERGDIKGAINEYRQAVQIHPDKGVLNHIRELQKGVQPKTVAGKTQKSTPIKATEKDLPPKTKVKPVQKKNTPSPWTGHYVGGINGSQGGETAMNLRFSLSLVQEGNTLSGTFALSDPGNNVNENSSVRGSCSGARGTISVNGQALPLLLRDRGRTVELAIDGQPLRLTRKR